MEEFLHKNKIIIGVMLIIIIILSSALLIYQHSRGKLFLVISTINFQQEFEALNNQNINLKKQISELELKLESKNNSSSNQELTNTSNLININVADQKTLENLPAIGAVRAKAIIDYRENKDSFSSINDIKKVSGISESTFNKIKDLITF